MVSCKNHPDYEGQVICCEGCRNLYCPNCIVKISGKLYCADCAGLNSNPYPQIVNEQDEFADPPLHVRMELASIGARFAALIIDGIVLAVPFGIIFAGLVFYVVYTESRQENIGNIIVSNVIQSGVQLFLMALPFVYEGLMLQIYGQTVGKMIMKIKVVTSDGKEISGKHAWIRALVRVLLGKFMCCIGVLVNYIPAFTTNELTCLHDMAAKTRVVVNKPPEYIEQEYDY